MIVAREVMMSKSTDHCCMGCVYKDERIEGLKETITILKGIVIDANKRADIYCEKAEWWMSHRTGRPANIPRPNHLKLVSFQDRK
jgi:hypothetical protein